MSAAAASLPPDLQELLDTWDAVDRDAEALLLPLDDEQFNWSPAPGAWSIAQCLDHLNVANAVYLEGIRQAIAQAERAGYERRGPIAPTWWGRRFIASMGPRAGASMRMRAPRKIRPAPRRLKAEVWPEFVRLHNRLRALVSDQGARLDLNRAGFPNPFIRGIRMRVGTALRVIAAHDRRHVRQAQRVREAPGFPRS
jgi:hypothetical protein